MPGCKSRFWQFVLSVVCLTAAVVSCCSADALPRKALQAMRAEQIRQTRELVIKADDQVSAVMKSTASTLLDFYHKYGHYPQTSTQENKIMRQVWQRYSGNPYHLILSEEDKNKVEHLPVVFAFDPDLSDENVERYKTKPPGQWSAEPGTINIVVGNNNLAVVWAAGMDKKPICFSDSGKTRLYILRARKYLRKGG